MRNSSLLVREGTPPSLLSLRRSSGSIGSCTFCDASVDVVGLFACLADSSFHNQRVQIFFVIRFATCTCTAHSPDQHICRSIFWSRSKYWRTCSLLAEALHSNFAFSVRKQTYLLEVNWHICQVFFFFFYNKRIGRQQKKDE